MWRRLAFDGVPSWLTRCVAGALFVALVLLGLYVWNFPKELSNKQEVWGQFGDFVGGILNPLFSIIGLLALLYTINLQSKEMKASTAQLTISAAALTEQNVHNDRQQYDSRLFNLVSLHSQIAASIAIYGRHFGPLVSVAGELAEHQIYRGVRGIEFTHNDLLETYFVDAPNLLDDEYEFGFVECYKRWKQAYWAPLSKYYLSLSNIISFIKNNQAFDNDKFSVDLLRSQLSMGEQRLLLYVACLDEEMHDSLDFLVSNKFGRTGAERDYYRHDLSNLVSIRLSGSKI